MTEQAHLLRFLPLCSEEEAATLKAQLASYDLSRLEELHTAVMRAPEKVVPTVVSPLPEHKTVRGKHQVWEDVAIGAIRRGEVSVVGGW